MPRALFHQFVINAFLGCMISAALLSLPGLEKVSGQESAKQQDGDEAARSDLPFRVYAQWAIDSFDVNRDGSLTKDEMKAMKSPLLEDRFDKNENGKLSFDEIVEAIRKRSSAKVEEEQTPDPRELANRASYVKYANGLINSYDEDKDGFINLAEAEKMRRPIKHSADTNQDGLFSLNEITESLGSQGVRNKKQKPTVVVRGDLNLEVETLAERSLEASLKNNDKNGDGKLDASEIASINWSTIRWQDSDTNDDGALTREELKDRYQKMFSMLLANQARAKKGSRRQSSTQDDADEKRAKMIELAESIHNQQQAKQFEAAGDILGGLAGNSGSGGMLGGLMSNSPLSKSARLNSKNKTEAVKTFVNVELYLLRLPVNSDSGRLANAFRALNDSQDPTGKAVANLAKQVGISNYDQLVFSALTGRTSRVQSGAVATRITGTTQTARGQSFNKTYVDIGLKAEVTPELNDNGIILAIELEKSDLIVLGKEDEGIPEDLIVNWTYDSSVQIRQGKPAIIGSSTSGQHWVLVVDAKQVR